MRQRNRVRLLVHSLPLRDARCYATRRTLPKRIGYALRNAAGGKRDYDAVVVGSGPNGLAAAIVLAQAGRSVLVLEAQPTIGGGARSAELTRPGFIHDVCSAIHPLARATPFFQSLQLERYGLQWIEPPVQLAHPLDDQPAPLLFRSVAATAATLGDDDAAYRSLLQPFVDDWGALIEDALAPPRIPKHPLLLGRFGLVALRSADSLAHRRFDHAGARAFFAGMAAHSAVPLTRTATASFGLMLAAAGHSAGWPIPVGGSGNLSRALAAHLQELGGEIVRDTTVRSLADVPPTRTVMLDVTPRQALEIAGDRFSARYRRALGRYRYGPGVCKVDWALSQPVPWRDPACARAGTVHIGGSIEEIVAAEDAPWKNEHAERPFVLVAQPSLFDATRAPAGSHTLWGYCHVPNGSTLDVSERIELQIERFAPGFRDCILARNVWTADELQQHNANLVGGDIGGGANTVDQLFLRPVARRIPYETSIPGLYLCSSATPPGGGVHGLCGMHAAHAALTGPAFGYSG